VPGGGLGQRGEVRRSGGWRGQGENPGRLADLVGEYPQFAVEHEEGLVVPVVDVDRARV